MHFLIFPHNHSDLVEMLGAYNVAKGDKLNYLKIAVVVGLTCYKTGTLRI